MNHFFSKTQIGLGTALIIIGLAVFGFIETSRADAEAVTGWAFSSNTGWIDMNGVFLDSVTGRFSGHAWSPNIGWISFNGGSDTAGCVARMNPKVNNDGVASGYARAINGTGITNGYTGCIELGQETTVRNPSRNVILSAAGTAGQKAFSGFAWGASESIGWIDFSGVFVNVGTGLVPQITQFSANPNQVPRFEPMGGTNVTIAWDSLNSDYCDTTSFGGTASAATSGTRIVNVSSFDTPKVYTLRCYNNDGLFDVASISIVQQGEEACELGDPECAATEPTVPIFEEF